MKRRKRGKNCIPLPQGKKKKREKDRNAGKDKMRIKQMKKKN